MAKKNRRTLKRYFQKGALPTEDQFGDLIDSNLNTIDEGFDKSPENGFEISLIGDHHRLISFFKSGAAKDAVWSIDYDKEKDRLFIRKPKSAGDRPAAMTFASDDRVGISKENPSCTLDVGGVIAAEGRIGANPDNRKTVAADGKWHNITPALNGCHAIEVVAGVGSKGTGKYALMHALAALVPRPRANLTRFHGVFAPNSKHRALVTPSKRGKSAKRQINGEERSPVEQHASMTWAQRLKRVFNIDVSTCDACGGAVKIIASIEDPVVIKLILAHLQRKAESKEYNLLPESRAPPQKSLFG